MACIRQLRDNRLSFNRIIFHMLCSLRASSRDVSEMEQSAAPAGGARNPAPGRPGKPTGGHYDPSASCSLDWDWRKASSQEARTQGLCLRPSRRRDRDGAPRGARILQKRMRQDGRLVRHSVLHPLALCEGEERPHEGAGATAYPAPQRIGAMTHACKHPSLIPAQAEIRHWVPAFAGTSGETKRRRSIMPPEKLRSYICRSRPRSMRACPRC